jgi:PAS domain S-box-containing protein
LSEASAQGRETLERHNAACLLWDGDRLRIVWANEAGLRLFGAETLFDLIDMRFDAGEPGAALVRRLRRELKTGEARAARFEFAAAGNGAALDATCSLHPLDDGRPGVLLIGTAKRGEADGHALGEAFMHLPLAAAVLDSEGSVIGGNRAAEEYFPEDGSTLPGLLNDSAAAAAFLARALKTGTSSMVGRCATALGTREARLVARRMGAAEQEPERLVVTIEDITERRALERMLAGKMPPQPILGTQVKATIAAEATEADVPAMIRQRLEAEAEAIIILRGSELLYANGKALALLGAASLRTLRENRAFTEGLARGGQSLIITDARGKRLALAVDQAPIPWNMGWASQAKLTFHAPERPATEDLESQHMAPPPATEAEAAVAPAPAPPLEKTQEDIGWKPDDAELSAILDTASDGIVTLDSEGRIRSFSAGAEAIFGQPKALVLDRPFAELLTADTRKIFRDYLAALSDSGLAAVFNDGREVSANVGPGRSLPLFLTISRIHVESKSSGAGPAFCAVVRDITQWKQTEAELREAKERAEQTSRQKSEFLARISHELRTPLNAILGFSELMRLERFGKLQNDKYRGYVSDIHSSGSHLLSLINDLLDLSKVEAGKLELNFTSVSLPEVTDHAIRLLAERAQQARVSVRRNFPPDLPNVVADLRSMRQIMINLISNAIKFTDPSGQVTITGRLARSGELVLRVRDTGVGMSEEDLKNALEPFQRVTSAARPDIEGTGLGLPLTKALTEANRASFAISSEPGKGTLVEITYPTTRVLAA